MLETLICMQARQLLQARDEIRSAQAPKPGHDWERLTPSDDLNFTSHSWSIALNRKTGECRGLRADSFILRHQPCLLIAQRAFIAIAVEGYKW